MTHSGKYTVLRAALAIALLGYLIYLIDIDQIANAAATADIRWILLALFLLPVNVLLEGVLWRRMVLTVAPQTNLGRSLGSLLCGFALGIFTPGRAGEFAGRAFYLRHPDKWELGTLVLTQRMLDFVAAVNTGMAVFLVYLLLHAEATSTLWWILAFVGGGTVLFLTPLALLPQLTHKLLSKILRKPGFRRRIAFLKKQTSRSMASLLALAFVRYLVYCTQFVLLALAFGSSIRWHLNYAAVALVFLVKFLIPSITLTDLGVREGAAVFFFGQFGVGEAVAFNAAFALYCINLLLPALAGVPFVTQMRFRQSADEKASSESAADFSAT